MTIRRAIPALLATGALWLSNTPVAVADNCGSPSDCFGASASVAVAAFGLLGLALLWWLLDSTTHGQSTNPAPDTDLDQAPGTDPQGDGQDWWTRTIGIARNMAEAARERAELEPDKPTPEPHPQPDPVRPPSPEAERKSTTASKTYPHTDAKCKETGRVKGKCSDYEWGYLKNGQFEAMSERGFFYRNCTDYVAWRIGRTWGEIEHGGGSAKYWKDGWIHRGRPWSKSKPRVGSVAWWDGRVGGGYGHVAYVSDVLADGRIVVEEFNYGGDGEYGTRTISLDDEESAPHAFLY